MQIYGDHGNSIASRLELMANSPQMMTTIGDPALRLGCRDYSIPGEDSFIKPDNAPEFSHYVKALPSLQCYLPSEDEDSDTAVDAFSCDDFRMFEFKVKKCVRARSHDWTECPFAHPGEKARRRDPRECHYSGTACPDFRKGVCVRGDACEYAHGVFECWLHPARYRTEPCKEGTHCRRRVCFFAHTADQLRVLPYPTTALDAVVYGSSPTSTFYSPPSSPAAGSSPVVSISQLSDSIRRLRVNPLTVGIGLSSSPPAWKPVVGSPRSPFTNRTGFGSLPTTPGRTVNRSSFSAWEIEEEETMERVESGRELREKIYSKLVQENSLERVTRVEPLDLGWVSDLVK